MAEPHQPDLPHRPDSRSDTRPDSRADSRTAGADRLDAGTGERPPAGFDEAPTLPFPGLGAPAGPGAGPDAGRWPGPGPEAGGLAAGGLAAGGPADAGRSGLRRPAVWGGALVATLGLGYLAAAAVLADRVPGGTTVAGLAVGGLTRDAAVQAIAEAQQDPAVPVAVGGEKATLDAKAAGLTVDPQAVVGRVTGFSLAPSRLWRHIGGGPRLEAGGQDAGRLTTELRTVAQDLDVPAADAGVKLQGTTPVLTPSTAGRSLDIEASAVLLRRSWLGADAPLTLPVRTTPAEIDDAEAKAALDGVVKPALASPLTVKAGGKQVRLDPEAVAPTLRLVPGDGGLTLAVDGPALKKAVLAEDTGIETEAEDARIELRNGRPVVVPDVPGLTLDAAKLADAARTVLLQPGGSRLVQAPTVASPAKVTAAKIAELGVKEKVSTFSTNLTDNPLRTKNLTVAARTVNGTLVLPGETFSLNGVLGERTKAKGYNEAPAINGGRLVRDVGGGVSQMATTIFNNVFFAGLQDVYHKPHSFYISRYPEGREATVNWPTVDLKWRNDSPYAVLIEASVSRGQVHVSFWSTKRWDIKATKSERSNFRTPKTVYDPKPSCVSQDANTGFDVTVTRLFYKPGSTTLVKKQSWTTTYIAEDKVICAPEPAKTP